MTYNTIKVLELADYYAMTNIGTGSNEPHSIILKFREHSVMGVSNIGIDDAVEKAFNKLRQKRRNATVI